MIDEKIVTKKIQNILESYEDKKDIKYICVSKKLFSFLKKPSTLLGLEVIVEPLLYKYAYFFVTKKPYQVPAQAHTIEFKNTESVALEVTRVVSPLYDTAQYQTKIAGKTTMNELGFIIANIIREMDDNNICKKADLLGIIDNYLKD